MIKMCIFDVDGTLYDLKDHKIISTNADAAIIRFMYKDEEHFYLLNKKSELVIELPKEYFCDHKIKSCRVIDQFISM